MAAAGTGLRPQAGGAGNGQRHWAAAESVLNKPQSRPTVLLILLIPFFPWACFLSPQRHRVALRGGRCEKSEDQPVAWGGQEGRGLQRNSVQGSEPTSSLTSTWAWEDPKPHGLSSSPVKPDGLRSPRVGLHDAPEGWDAAARQNLHHLSYWASPISLEDLLNLGAEECSKWTQAAPGNRSKSHSLPLP